MTPPDTRVEVVLDGRSAKVYRYTEMFRRRWFGLLPDRVETVQVLIGAYPCDMALEMARNLNRPRELTLTLGGSRVVLRERCGQPVRGVT